MWKSNDDVSALSGYSRAIGLPEGEYPFCTTSNHDISSVRITDFVGPLPGHTGPREDCRIAEWETEAPREARDTVFVWIGGNQIRPTRASAHPFIEATLSVNGVPRLTFPLNVTECSIEEGDFTLEFSARRYQSLAETGPHRKFNPDGLSGVFRLTVNGNSISAGQPLRLSVEIEQAPPGHVATYYTSPRVWSPEVDGADMAGQVVQLQRDMIQLRQSFEQLYAQTAQELQPARIPASTVVVHAAETKHYHPANLTVLQKDDLLITIREAEDHLDINGRLVTFRSSDHGLSWEGPKLLFDKGRSDHRSGCVFELPSGDWITWDYRCGANYSDSGLYLGPNESSGPTLWGAWSTDEGKHWEFTQPLTVPGAYAFAEAERPIIQLPNGRLLLAGHCIMPSEDDTQPVQLHRDFGEIRVVIFHSDDNGRSWSCLAKLPRSPFPLVEPSIVDCGERIVLVTRSERHFRGGRHWRLRGGLMQSVSEDGGSTWSDWLPTGMSSMSSPAHLLKLADGRLLCTHGQREHPRSILLTLSYDDGATWDTDHTRVLADDIANFDACYPVSGQLSDGSIVSTWYGNRFGRFYIMAALYKTDDL